MALTSDSKDAKALRIKIAAGLRRLGFHKIEESETQGVVRWWGTQRNVNYDFSTRTGALKFIAQLNLQLPELKFGLRADFGGKPRGMEGVAPCWCITTGRMRDDSDYSLDTQLDKEGRPAQIVISIPKDNAAGSAYRLGLDG